MLLLARFCWRRSYEMSDNTVFIGYGGGLFATVMGGKQSWGARTPAELIAKLDACGVDRARLELIGRSSQLP
ncbi:hypothetical protein [Lysobacter gummosus]|uniref:hypothetical protein n=2 Tax=Lysobacter gummosus TaxID=262324 RepID=UPI0036419DBF